MQGLHIDGVLVGAQQQAVGEHAAGEAFFGTWNPPAGDPHRVSQKPIAVSQTLVVC